MEDTSQPKKPQPTQAGKGSTPRPTDYRKWSTGYERVYGNKEKKDARK